MLLGITVASIVGSLSVGAASAQPPVGAGQHFIGRVNGRRRDVVVKAICPGPTSPGRQGPVAAGQVFSTYKTRRGPGDTGLFTQIYAWFEPAPGSAAPVAATITSYATKVPIPNGVRVPCDGTGRVEFSSCPYLAPCAFGWVSDFVDVRFVNVAD
jgi:hypothetical protein